MPPITPTSIATGLFALLWLVLLFSSIAGWGLLAARVLRLAHPEFALALSLGLAFQCLLGSILNITYLIQTPILLTLIAVGLLSYLVHFRTRIPRLTPALILISTLILLHLITFIHPPSYERMDDLQAYLLLPVKMLQTHHLAPDPFSQRRVIGALAFNYYLQDLFLTLGPLKNLTLVDGAGGILLLCATALGLARTLGLTRNQTLGFLLIAGLTKQIWWNLGFMWLPCAMFLALAYLASHPALSDRPILQPILVGAVGGAAGALKNNHLVYSVLYAFLFYALLATSAAAPAGLAARLRFFASRVTLAAAGALTVLIFWMVDLKHFSGTYFFPVLGHGFEYTTYGLLPVRHLSLGNAMLKVILSGLPLLLVAAAAAAILLWQNRQSSPVPAERDHVDQNYPLSKNRHSGEAKTSVLAVAPSSSAQKPGVTQDLQLGRSRYSGEARTSVLASLPSSLIPLPSSLHPLPTWTQPAIALLALTVTGALATALTALATGADNIRRYCYPEIIVAIIALPPIAFYLANRRPNLRLATPLKVAAIALVALAFASDVWNSIDHWLSPALYYQRHLSLTPALRNAPLNTPAELTEYQALQNALPPHAVALEQVLYPYLLDNTRQTFYEASLPAMASPPPAPGWPVLSDGNALAAWLLSHNVRYLIYSYGDYAGWPDPFLAQQSVNPQQTTILQSTLHADLLVHQQYAQLAGTRRHLFDDGHIYILDLETSN